MTRENSYATLDATGQVPASQLDNAAATAYAPGDFTTATGNFAVMADLLQLNGTQVASIEGTAVLVIL